MDRLVKNTLIPFNRFSKIHHLHIYHPEMEENILFSIPLSAVPILFQFLSKSGIHNDLVTLFSF